MKLTEAIEQLSDWLKEDLGPHRKVIGISLRKEETNIIITPELLESTDWGVTVENSDPSFMSLVGSLANEFNGINKPHLVSVKNKKETSEKT